jgi:hypothetical protein
MDAIDEELTATVSKCKKRDDILVRGKNAGASKLLDWIVSSVAESCSLG